MYVCIERYFFATLCQSPCLTLSNASPRIEVDLREARLSAITGGLKSQDKDNTERRESLVAEFQVSEGPLIGCYQSERTISQGIHAMWAV